MTQLDEWGCPISTNEAQPINETIELFVRMAPGVDKHFAALEVGAPIARCLLAQLLVQAHRPELNRKAVELTDQLANETSALSSREQGHIAATAAWAAGHTNTTIDIFADVLADYPTDVLALRSRELLLFNSGQPARIVEMIGSIRPWWSDDLPLASFLDGMESFGLEEGGVYAQAEEVGKRGVSADETDMWAIHAVAHVMEMQERRQEGVDWLSGREDSLVDSGRFIGHLWWHLAIQQLALGETEAALNIFDTSVFPVRSEEGLDLSNAISLLARLEAHDVDVGDRWQLVADPAFVRVGHHSNPFNDTHFVLALARAGRTDDSTRIVTEMTKWSERDDYAGGVLRKSGLAVAEAMAAYGAGDWSTAVTKLEPVAGDVWHIGGSHAQRQLYTLILDTSRERAA